MAVMADDIGIKVRLGLEDKEATDWSGSVSVEPGNVALISGWRFLQQDKVNGTTGWICRTRPNAQALQRRSNNPKKEAARPADAATSIPLSDNGVLVTFTGVKEDSKVTIETAKGEFTFAFADIPPGKIIPELEGALEVERAAASAPFTAETNADEDYPSGAVAPDGTVWAAWQSFTPGLDRAARAKPYETEPADLKFLATPPGGDQLWLRPLNGEAIAITPTGRDIYKSAVAVDGAGLVWVVWAENAGYKPFPDNPRANFDIFARSYDPKSKKLGKPENLSNAIENDVWPVATTDSEGHVWMAWQGARENVFRIFERHQTKGGWSKAEQVSTQKHNCWAPAIASTTGKVAIAWDTYEKGDYDVWMREFAGGKAGEARPVANTPDYEARPAMTYDKTGALWIAWEKSGPTWGKNFGALVKNQGIPLYRDRQIGLAVLKDGQWMQTTGSFVDVLPGANGPRKRQRNMRVPPLEPGGESRKAGQEAEATKNFTHNNLARIVCDNAGRIWLFCRSRQNDFRTPLGSLWFDWACYTDGDHWTGSMMMPHSDNLMYNLPVVVPTGNDLTIVHSSDHRQDRHGIPRKGNANAALGTENDPYVNDLYVSHLEAIGPAQEAKLIPAELQPDAQAAASPATVKERGDIANIHAYRAEVDGKKLQIQRGEFHRHTEISGDGGNDGPLEDLWRYAIDVAAMDWLGCGDHDNGTGREYTWWLTQKTTDAFLPAGFI